MKKIKKSFVGAVSVWFAVFSLALVVDSGWAKDESGAELQVEEQTGERISYHRYSNLSELVTLICDDAMEMFHGFYGPTRVAVSPFSVIRWSTRSRSTISWEWVTRR